MKVQFDLRPIGMLEKERKQKSFNLTRTIAVLLLAAFFVTSIGYLVMMTIERLALKDRVIENESIVSVLEREKTGLQTKVTELRAREKVFSDTLNIMQDDLPTIEVLNALETNIDEYGIGLDTLRFIVGNVAGVNSVVEVTGLAATDKQIIDYSDRLRASGVFTDVLLPVTTLNESTGLISFTLRMPYLPIGQIKRP